MTLIRSAPTITPSQESVASTVTFSFFRARLQIFVQTSPAAGTLFFIKGAFSRLLQHLTDPTLFSMNRIHSESDSQEYLFSKLCHIMKSSHGRCTREELTTQLHYNGEYLNRIMKKYPGKTILEYGQEIYLEEARQLLSDTERSISAIIDELGFSNRSHFYRLFEKRYGETPLDYRRRVRSENSLSG